MKHFATASLLMPATAAFVPGIMIMQHRAGVTMVPPSQPQLYYYRSRSGTNDCENSFSSSSSSFDDLRREFTSSSSEPSADQVKQVVGRTFRFFQMLNREATSSTTTEQSRNEELLDKLQKWIERTIDVSDELTKDFGDQPSPKTESMATMSSTSNTSDHAGADPTPIGGTTNTTTNPVPTDESEDNTLLDKKNRLLTADTFEVELDVPGVELVDLDIQLDESLKIVTVLGQRGGRSFSRGIALDAEADIQNLSATLKNGVLTLRAPKMKPPTPKIKRIPVVVVDDADK